MADDTITTNTTTFGNFDLTKDYSDHQYANQNVRLSDKATKTITKEWKILQKHLPNTIYVRVYQTRMDLLRAAVVGATGTPYHDGLFFFDIGFPSDYPNHPPTVRYRSFGLRINPNLYASGYVCLSLLNTWAGKPSERWTPGQSNVLQVLLSLQGLVLNEKPYHNEPTLNTRAGRFLLEKKAIAYNENVFLLSCKTMTYLLRQPPKGFDRLVKAHFTERGSEILRACKWYMSGRVQVGFDEKKKGSNMADLSATFKLGMDDCYPKLVSSFAKCGAPVQLFVEELEQANHPQPACDSVHEEEKKKKKKKKTGGSRFLDCFFRLKQNNDKKNLPAKTCPDPI